MNICWTKCVKVINVRLFPKISLAFFFLKKHQEVNAAAGTWRKLKLIEQKCDVCFLQVEKDQKFIPYVWTVMVSTFIFQCPFDSCPSFSFSLFLFFLFLFLLTPVLRRRGGTTNTSPGIQISFVALIMSLFPLRCCGSQISLSKKCKYKWRLLKYWKPIFILAKGSEAIPALKSAHIITFTQSFPCHEVYTF